MPCWSKNWPQADYFQSKQAELTSCLQKRSGTMGWRSKKVWGHYFVLPRDQGNEIGQWKDCFDRLCLKLCFYFHWVFHGAQNFGGPLAAACHWRQQTPSSPSCWADGASQWDRANSSSRMNDRELFAGYFRVWLIMDTHKSRTRFAFIRTNVPHFPKKGFHTKNDWHFEFQDTLQSGLFIGTDFNCSSFTFGFSHQELPQWKNPSTTPQPLRLIPWRWVTW